MARRPLRAHHHQSLATRTLRRMSVGPAVVCAGRARRSSLAARHPAGSLSQMLPRRALGRAVCLTRPGATGRAARTPSRRPGPLLHVPRPVPLPACRSGGPACWLVKAGRRRTSLRPALGRRQRPERVTGRTCTRGRAGRADPSKGRPRLAPSRPLPPPTPPLYQLALPSPKHQHPHLATMETAKSQSPTPPLPTLARTTRAVLHLARHLRRRALTPPPAIRLPSRPHRRRRQHRRRDGPGTSCPLASSPADDVRDTR